MEKTTLEYAIDYFKSEYKETKAFLERKVSWATPRESVYNAIQRMLGVAMFAQTLDVKMSYDDIEQAYNFYKEKLENLLTD